MNQDSSTKQSTATWMLGGLALGAAAMFLTDPDRGRRRRALARDKLYKMRSAVTRSGTSIDVAIRDLRNRAQGLTAQARHRLLHQNAAPDDRKLCERVRQCLGRAVTHPRAIEVSAHQGSVTLAGPVLAHEKEHLLEAVRKVGGVHEIQDMLEVRERAGNVSSLQGSGLRPSSASARDSWRPANRALAIAGGSALSMYGAKHRTALGFLIAATGLGLISRAVTNMPFSRLAGMSGDAEAINLQKTIHIEAPLEQVFDMFAKYENFPRFMSHVREVQDFGNGRSRWVVEGPAGTSVEWNAKLTECKRPHALAWHSEPGAAVRNNGRIRFEAEGTGTRVSIHMWYSPPGGVLGYAVASLFGRDAKHEMDDDLMRMKEFIETGIRPRDAAKPAAQADARAF